MEKVAYVLIIAILAYIVSKINALSEDVENLTDDIVKLQEKIGGDWEAEE